MEPSVRNNRGGRLSRRSRVCRSRKRSADGSRRGPSKRGRRAPLVEEVVNAPETEVLGLWRPYPAEEGTIFVVEVVCRLVAVVDELSLVRGVTCRVSGGEEVPGFTRALLW